MSMKYSGNIENNGARPKATRDESKEPDLKFKTRESFDEIFRIAVVGENVRLGWSSP